MLFFRHIHTINCSDCVMPSFFCKRRESSSFVASLQRFQIKPIHGAVDDALGAGDRLITGTFIDVDRSCQIRMGFQIDLAISKGSRLGFDQADLRRNRVF